VAVVTMLAAVLINFLLLLAGFGVPNMIKSMSPELRPVDYTLLQLTDPILSLYHVAEHQVTPEAGVLLLVVPAVALCVLLANMPFIIREVHEVRIAAPQRVVEDEAELHPPPAAQPTNPWDELTADEV
jgi:hypothetical protein